MMLSVPAAWWIVARIRGLDSPIPWAGVAFFMEPFLVDVTGNTLNLYDQIAWWDDLNHFVNWGFMSFGIGILLRRAQQVPAWAIGTMVAGYGAILAILWEVGEWYTFIRHGKELDTAYEDTLFDQVLGDERRHDRRAHHRVADPAGPLCGGREADLDVGAGDVRAAGEPQRTVALRERA